MYRRGADRAHYITRTGSHATKGLARGVSPFELVSGWERLQAPPQPASGHALSDAELFQRLRAARLRSAATDADLFNGISKELQRRGHSPAAILRMITGNKRRK